MNHMRKKIGYLLLNQLRIDRCVELICIRDTSFCTLCADDANTSYSCWVFFWLFGKTWKSLFWMCNSTIEVVWKCQSLSRSHLFQGNARLCSYQQTLQWVIVVKSISLFACYRFKSSINDDIDLFPLFLLWNRKIYDSLPFILVVWIHGWLWRFLFIFKLLLIALLEARW